MFDFTFLEYNLIVLTTSFFIFSFEIKSQAHRKFYELLSYLNEMKKDINAQINNKSPKNLQDKKQRLIDLVDSKIEIFNYCLPKVAIYVYHSFYLIFFFSSIGLVLSMVYELNIFNLNTTYNLNWFNFLIHIFSILLLYWVLRAIFCLICYTKMDFGYVERLSEHIENKMYYDFGQIEDTPYTFKKIMGIVVIFFRITLFRILFLGLIIWDNKFKQFFYNYYNL